MMRLMAPAPMRVVADDVYLVEHADTFVESHIP